MMVAVHSNFRFGQIPTKRAVGGRRYAAGLLIYLHNQLKRIETKQ
jgi:hypothetical protein